MEPDAFPLVLGWGLHRFMRARRESDCLSGAWLLLAHGFCMWGFKRLSGASRQPVRGALFQQASFRFSWFWLRPGRSRYPSVLFVTTDPAGARLASRRVARRIQGAILGGALAIWLLLSVGLVLALQSRGVNYKSAARWIQQHVPVDGVYADI